MHSNRSEPPIAACCTCFQVRGLARRLTALYDAALAEHGLTVTQYATLATLQRASSALPVAQLARRLQMDRTTTTRLIAPLHEQGLVVRVDARSGFDARAHPMQITAKGRRRLAAAVPAWQAAQRQVDEILGERLSKQLHSATDAAGRALAEVAESTEAA
jgi:DNA-binding MarR family transcriptional regulator